MRQTTGRRLESPARCAFDFATPEARWLILGQNFYHRFVDRILGDESDNLVGYLTVLE